MKLYSWNVNGIRAAEKKGLVDWIQSEQPDVLGIQEVKATEDQLSDALKHIDGYHVFFQPCRTQGLQRHGGLLQNGNPFRFTPAFPTNASTTKGRTIVMEYPEFTLYNIYFPNGGQGEDRLKFKNGFLRLLPKRCG
jgi:exodeoxyribonuclease-3